MHERFTLQVGGAEKVACFAERLVAKLPTIPRVSLAKSATEQLSLVAKGTPSFANGE